MNSLFDSSISESKNNIEIVFIDSNIYEELIDVLFMIDEFLLFFF